MRAFVVYFGRPHTSGGRPLSVAAATPLSIPCYKYCEQENSIGVVDDGERKAGERRNGHCRIILELPSPPLDVLKTREILLFRN